MRKRCGLVVLMVCGVLRLLGGIAFSAPEDEAYKRGLDAYNRQDYAAALREWLPLAQQGNPRVQNYLGVMYSKGRGVAQSDAEAVKWYRKAAGQGYASGQNNLGVMYRDGRGVTQSNAEAVKWFRKAAEQGDDEGQNNLGVMYANGRGVTQSDAEAVKWYRKAADQGYALGQSNLGFMYRDGRGVAQSDAEAVQWFRKAVEQGNANGQTNLGFMYQNGRGVSQNDAEAVKWYQKAADQGNALGQTNLGRMYQNGLGVSQNDAEALKWYQKAADQGYAPGQYNLGLMYEKGRGITQNLMAAQRWLAKAAETYPPGTDRDNAIQARDRVARKLATAPASPSQPAPSPAVPPRRALVIGNAAYPTSPLTNPVNDATDLAALLRRVGFDVALHQNADRPTMEKAVDAFTRGVPSGSAGLFFYAGHGVQVDGVNYLIPIGARFSAASDVKYHAVAADWVLARMDESGMDVKLLLLDACRDNPLGRSFTRALSRGLGVMETPQGALIAYATSPGKTALDGTGRNSPFTVQLLRELGSPGRDIEVALKAVRAGVQQSTQGKQVPWVASSMTGDFYLGR